MLSHSSSRSSAPSAIYISIPTFFLFSPVFPLPNTPHPTIPLSLSKMDMYGSLSAPDCFPIDDLLDFSNHDLTTTSSSSSADSHHHHLPPPQDPFHHHQSCPNPLFHDHLFLPSTDSTADLCVPSDDLAELEWLSQFIDDSFNDFPTSNTLPASTLLRSDTSFPSKARSKRSKAPTPSSSSGPANGKPRPKTEQNAAPSVSGEGGVRRCTHCASEKTPQWRTGPLGPKTLCNACGVRYKSGRLVPEYRPAASPTFVLTQHSNSHRKVMELRRQKELVRQQQLLRLQ